ncbi:FG-GAP-like repeat-containing protein [Streptomyces jumonjinensis]|uniref:FG-GAP-like repeat-containing protein n=1 Tax=Streptomyces jumonjinensis TaxID=1945 RepID=UPI0037915581
MNSHSAVRALVLASAIAVTASLAAPVASADQQPPKGLSGAGQPDFNGDGYGDVAVSAPRATVNGEKYAGYVSVLYGSKTKTVTASKRVFHQNTPGVPGNVGSDEFGAALASADLDRDGYTDLVVGAPFDNMSGSGMDAGSLTVIWGSRQGLSTSALLLRGSQKYSKAGHKVVTGDFDGDGDQDIATNDNRTDLRVLDGPFRRNGQAAGTSLLKDRDNVDITDLASGDVNKDQKDDIVATRGFSGETEARHTVLWQGSAEGLRDYSVVTGPEEAPLRGEHVALGDINGDGHDDLVVGRAQEERQQPDPQHLGGTITYLPGSESGPLGEQSQAISQRTPGVPGSPQWGDAFGTGLSIGDIDGDGYGDLVTGIPGEGFNGRNHAGWVTTVPGSWLGPDSAKARAYSQDTPGVPGVATTWDNFGTNTAVTDTNGDGRGELIVAAAREYRGTGSVYVFKAAASGVTTKGTILVRPKDIGMPGEDQGFGTAFSR